MLFSMRGRHRLKVYMYLAEAKSYSRTFIWCLVRYDYISSMKRFISSETFYVELKHPKWEIIWELLPNKGTQ